MKLAPHDNKGSVNASSNGDSSHSFMRDGDSSHSVMSVWNASEVVVRETSALVNMGILISCGFDETDAKKVM